MRLLLDTHIAIWFVDGDQMLSARGKAMIEDEANVAFVSVASVWEIAIKSALRKGRLDDVKFDGHEAAVFFDRGALESLAISRRHAALVGDLPHHHRDPFDRLLVAQAKCESMRLLTHERRLAAYGDHVLVV